MIARDVKPGANGVILAGTPAPVDSGMSALAEKLAKLGLEPCGGKDFQPASTEEIAELEKTIGVRLPEDYRQFLLAYGRSMFSALVNCTPSAKPLYFGWFFCVAEVLTAIDGWEDALPETIIPIADDDGGNAFCLGVSGPGAGKVYFHNHSWGWHADAERLIERGEPVPPDIRYRTVHQIASSFRELIDQMQPEEEVS